LTCAHFAPLPGGAARLGSGAEGGVLLQGGCPDPGKRMEGEEDDAGDAQQCPAAAGMRHTQGRSEGGRQES